MVKSPSSTPRKLTAYDADDGQELTSVQFTADGSTVTSAGMRPCSFISRSTTLARPTAASTSAVGE